MTQLAMFTSMTAATLATAAALALPTEPSPADTAAIRSLNHSGLELIRQTIKTETKAVTDMKNIVVSPLSSYSAFAMLHGGLEGKSRALFNQFLHVGPDEDATFDARSSSLINSLRMAPDPNEPRRPGFAHKPVLGISNSAWATSGQTRPPRFEFSQKFTRSLESNYLAEVKSTDFMAPSSADDINHWALEKTNKLIPRVITSDVLRQLSWLLINATYFEANWASKFQTLRGAAAPRFHLLNGRQVATEMISGHGMWNIVETPEYQAVELPFYDSAYSFFAVRPRNEKDFTTFTMKGTAFSQESWSELIAAFNRYASSPEAEATDVSVKVPKFSITSSETLAKGQRLTRAMGLDFLFRTENAADLAPLGGFVGGPPGGVVALIKQDAKIDVDENGVRAAAVTQIGGVGQTSRPEIRFKKDLVFDRPFLFFIGSKTTGIILFTGTAVNPSPH